MTGATKRELTESALGGLNARQLAFVTEYMKDRNAAQAYLRAGYDANPRRARDLAAQLLRHPEVARRIEEIEDIELTRIRHQAGISLETTIQAIARTAFYDVRKLFAPDGSPLPINEIDDDTAMAIESVEVIEQYEGVGADRKFVGYVRKYRLARRGTGLDQLMKHLNGYKLSTDEKGKALANSLGILISHMRRSALPIAQRVDHDQGV